jgi:Dyp-type peroxidase family
MTPEAFGALLVGRWRSGAPIMRAPSADNQALADNEFAVNHFAFNRDSTGAPPRDPLVHSDPFDQARSDFFGQVCPRFAHIRKVNPRDGATDLGIAQDTLLRTILRRGIPYGDSLLDVADPTPEQLAADRGLIFACYQTSIVDQFETLTRRWANSSVQPTPGGHDPIIGQGHSHEFGRRRFIDLPHRRCLLEREWILPTGGGYFFAPSMSAIKDVLGLV